jgi:small basic protein (TIGR04137 family)
MLLRWIGEKKLKTFVFLGTALAFYLDYLAELELPGSARNIRLPDALGHASLPTLRQAVIGIARGRFSEYNLPMSLHRSLRSGGSTAAKRNVLKRFERVTLLKKRGQWKAGMKSTGLPKTKPE